MYLYLNFQIIYIFALIFSSIIHDYKHPGLNNEFLINTYDNIAIKYNDQSPLENMHVAKAWKLLKKVNIFSKLPYNKVIRLREMIINIVLATDMA